MSVEAHAGMDAFGEEAPTLKALSAKRCTHPRPGGHVVVKDIAGQFKVFHLHTQSKDFRIGKYAPIPKVALLSCPFGGVIRHTEDGAWERRRRQSADEKLEVVDAEIVIDKNNQHFAQDNSAQSLSAAEVEELKKTCTGDEVIEKLVSSSSTFDAKTKFSQQKYLAKKRLKHVQEVSVMPPQLQHLCDCYWQSGPRSKCSIRFDYLSSLLSCADIRSGGRVLVLDCTAGIVVGALAQRLGGTGRVYRVLAGNGERGGASASDRAVAELDLGDEVRSVIRSMPLNVLSHHDPTSHEWFQERVWNEKSPEELARINAGKDEATLAAEAQTRADKAEKFRQSLELRRRDFADLQARRADSLVVVAGEDDDGLAEETLRCGLDRFLAPGGRVVVYGQHLQPLASLQGSWRKEGGFVDVKLIQLFTRQYQVLPQRTHPVMDAEAMLQDGFLLFASTVCAGDKSAVVDDEGPPGKKARYRS